MKKQGRPRGLNVNPAAVEDLLVKAGVSKSGLAAAAGITPSHLSDLLHRQKGASEPMVRAMAEVLECRPETIAPELLPLYLAVRPGDPLARAVAS